MNDECILSRNDFGLIFCFMTLRMMLQTLGLFLFLHVVPLQCKLILSTNVSKLVQNEGSQAEIVNSSLQKLDNFTLCARSSLV